MELASITSKDPVQDAQAQLLALIAEEQQRILDIAQLMQTLDKAKAEVDQLTKDQAELERQIAELEKELGQKGADEDGSSGSGGSSPDPEKEKKLKDLLGRLMMTNQAIEEKSYAISDLQKTIKTEQSALDHVMAADSSSRQNLQQLLRDAQTIERESVSAFDPTLLISDKLQKICEQARKRQEEELQQTQTSMNDASTCNQTKKATAEDVQQALKDMGQLQLQLAKDTQAIIQAIVDKQGDISKAQAELDRLKAELAANEWKLYVPFYDLFQISYIKGLRRQIEALESGIPQKKAELNGLIDQLKDKLAEMIGMDRSELVADMEQIGKLIQELLDIFKGVNPANSQSKFEQANVLLVTIMSILKVILAKAAGKKSDNDDMMTKGTMGLYEYAAQDANNNAVKVQGQIADLQKNQTFMDNLKIAMLVVAVLTAPITDGASFALFTLFEILQQTGALDKMTDAMAKALKGDGCNDEVSKWLAEAFTLIIILAATLGTGAASGAAKTGMRASERALETEARAMARELTESAFTTVAQGELRSVARSTTERVVETAVQKECLALEKATIGKMIAKKGAALAGRGQIAEMEVREGVKTVAKAAAKEAFEAAAKDAAKTALRQTGNGLRGSLTEAAQAEITAAAQKAASKAAVIAAERSLKSVGSVVTSAMASGARNTIDASVEKIALKEASMAVSKVRWGAMAGSLMVQQFFGANGLINAVQDIMKAGGKTQDDIDKNYQVLQIILQVIQVMLMMGAGFAATQATGAIDKVAESTGRTLLGASPEKLRVVGTALQIAGNGMTSYSNFQTMEIHNRLNKLHTVLAEDERQMIMYKSTLDEMQKLRENQSDVRSSMFESQERNVQRLVKNAGKAEFEVGRLLVERAV